ncbi:uncharacterized protein [Engystomops pustulosus]|uniref:uncharacterized protein n=1 Tax=Engystomops pustulosus TaxID=76066 RepID=UPI003AFB6CA8
MKNFPVFLLFVIYGIPIGEALRCQTCKALNAEDCTGESVPCKNEGDNCTKAIEHNSVNGMNIASFSRGCTSFPQMCGKLFTVTTPNFTLEIYNDCCNTNDCNVGKIIVPAKNTTKNGLSCKACFEEGTYVCKEFTTIECTGNEGDCLQYSGDATRPGQQTQKYALAGCATTGACGVAYDALVGTMPGNPRNLSCPVENRV